VPAAAWTFFFSFSLLSVQFGDGYISPGLPVGAAHLFSREMLSLAARPASDSSEVDHVTTPLQRQAGSTRFVSRLSEPLQCGQIIVCCLIFLKFQYHYVFSWLLLWLVLYPRRALHLKPASAPLLYYTHGLHRRPKVGVNWMLELSRPFWNPLSYQIWEYPE